MCPSLLRALHARDRVESERHVSKDVVDVAVLGVDDLAHLGQGIWPETLLCQAYEQRLPRLGQAPQLTQLLLILEELGECSSEAQYRATMAARTRAGNKPRPFRHYLLRGLVWCTCGTKMRGEAHVQRGTDRRYYRCPSVGCRARRSPAEQLEERVLAAIAEAALPDEVIVRARTELMARLSAPAVTVPARQRKRLLTRLEQLKKQHGWGDIDDAEYQRLQDEVRAALRELPNDDRVRSFDAFRARLLALPEAIAVASPQRRAELCSIVVERVNVTDREPDSIIWTPPVAPPRGREGSPTPQP